MTKAILEGRPIEEGRGHDDHQIEPTSGLGLILRDEVRGKVIVEPLFVLKGIVDLSKRHGSRLKPAVQDLGYTSHGRTPSRVVWVRASQFVDMGSMKIVWANTEIAFELVETAIDVGSGIVGIVALPYGNRGSPESISGDRPISRPFEPFSEKTVAHRAGNPIDFLVQRNHAISNRDNIDVP